MTAKETVQSLYAAYATRDPDRIAALLHPDVVWVAPAGNATQVALGLGSADDAGSPRGLNDLDRDAIVAFMAYDYPRFFVNVAFEPWSMVGEGDVVLTEHRMSATLPNGRRYVNDYCFAYEVADGRITAIHAARDGVDTSDHQLTLGQPDHVHATVGHHSLRTIIRRLVLPQAGNHLLHLDGRPALAIGGQHRRKVLRDTVLRRRGAPCGHVADHCIAAGAGGTACAVSSVELDELRVDWWCWVGRD